MSKLKVLNLYAGIGGNRKLWEDVEVTAVENYGPAADVYAHFWPQDILVRGDAHQYLLDHYSEFDFIWSSPPCPTHSRLNLPLHRSGIIRYPDMSLYQEIIFLKQWGRDIKWVVENVQPYYTPLVAPRTILDRHLFWSNFPIPIIKLPSLGDTHDYGWAKLGEVLGIELPAFVETSDKRLMLRDVTRPELGQHILKAAQKEVTQDEMSFHETLPSLESVGVSEGSLS